MIDSVPHNDEWLVFVLDGISFALPNSQSQQIGLINDLQTEIIFHPIPHLQDQQGNAIYILNSQLKPESACVEKRKLFLLLSDGGKHTIGLLCDAVDVFFFSQQNRKILAIPPVMLHSNSPLFAIAVSDTEKPVYLSHAQNIMQYIQRVEKKL